MRWCDGFTARQQGKPRTAPSTWDDRSAPPTTAARRRRPQRAADDRSAPPTAARDPPAATRVLPAGSASELTPAGDARPWGRARGQLGATACGVGTSRDGGSAGTTRVVHRPVCLGGRRWPRGGGRRRADGWRRGWAGTSWLLAAVSERGATLAWGCSRRVPARFDRRRCVARYGRSADARRDSALFGVPARSAAARDQHGEERPAVAVEPLSATAAARSRPPRPGDSAAIL
jgi:hypothetical protein